MWFVLFLPKQGCLVFSRNFWLDYFQFLSEKHPVGRASYYLGCYDNGWQLSPTVPFGVRSYFINLLSEKNWHPLIMQFLIGEGHVSMSQKLALQSTGTMHLMAISGLHVDALANMFSRICHRLRRLPRIWRISQFVIIFILTFYSYLVGFSVPVIRAVIMRVVKIVGQIYGVMINPWLTLEIALIVILISNPLVILSISFYLSFIAVACLMLSRSYFKGAVYLNLMMAALSLWFFGMYPLISPLVNYWLILLFNWGAPLILISGIWCVLFDSAGLSLQVLSKGLFELDEQLKSMSVGYWLVDHHSIYLYILIISIVIFIYFNGKHIGLMIVAMSAAFQMIKLPLAQGDFSFKSYEVGHGLMVSVRTASHYLLYDTSRSAYWVNRYALPDWHQAGFSKPTMVMISHPDMDHAGGLHLLQDFYSDLFVIGNQFDDKRSVTCLAGMHWHWDGVLFWVLGPDSMRLKGNDASCVLYIQAQTGESLIIPGDVMKDHGYGHSFIDHVIPPHHDRNPNKWYQMVWSNS